MRLARAVDTLQPLLQAQNEAELALAALQLRAEHGTLERAWLLRLSYDGRNLEVIAAIEGQGALQIEQCEGLSFSCSDFDQPFAHAVFSGRALCLSQLHCASGAQHPRYSAWIAPMNSGSELSVEPIYSAEKLYGLWAVQRSEDGESRRDVEALQQLLVLQLEGLLHRQRERAGKVQLANEVQALNSDLQRSAQVHQLAHSIIGSSAAVRQLQQRIAVAASAKLSVLICGETGVGKELVARAVHQLSERADKPFVALNCAAIPETLLESELFGYVKGAFSGAVGESKGLLGSADGGVFFLDEIGDMPFSLQAKLLRVLETRSYRQVGGTQEHSCDFRLVAATHHNIPALIAEQRFRSDLYYRLNSFPIQVPALRERREDIRLLAEHFIRRYNADNARAVAGLSSAVLEQLEALPLAGNVRELKNLIDYGCAHSADDGVIALLDTSAFAAPEPVVIEAVERESDFAEVSNLRAAVEQFETRLISARLRQCRGNKTMAAQTLGVPRRTFTHICQRLELTKQ
ncbi:MAG: sigma-54 interaction domain-containing protein [Pseudomonadales bacterium]